MVIVVIVIGETIPLVLAETTPRLCPSRPSWHRMGNRVSVGFRASSCKGSHGDMDLVDLRVGRAAFSGLLGSIVRIILLLLDIK